jgi:hypothetical protein
MMAVSPLPGTAAHDQLVVSLQLPVVPIQVQVAANATGVGATNAPTLSTSPNAIMSRKTDLNVNMVFLLQGKMSLTNLKLL